MWEAFAACVRQVRAGGAPDRRWPAASAATQRVLSAAFVSLQEGCRTVQLSEIVV